MDERKKQLRGERQSMQKSVERADTDTSAQSKGGGSTEERRGSFSAVGTSGLEPQKLNDIGNIMSTKYALKSMEKDELRKMIHYEPTV